MKLTVFNSFTFVVLLLSSSLALAATFEDARNAAFNGHRSDAISICKSLIKEDPSNHETRTFLGRLLAWDGAYVQAREQFEFVLAAKPDSVDARAGLIDVELWSDRPDAALINADEGLKKTGTSTVLLMKRATALRKLGRNDEAFGSAQHAIDLEPANTEAQDFIISMHKESALYKAAISYTHDELSQQFDPWDMVALSLSRRFSFGSVIARMNQANRFKSTGTQFELDAYPHLRDGTYLYLNAGYSQDSVFPQRRYGVEVYQSFGGGFEGSFGIRYLQFSSSIVRVLTGSLGMYFGNYYLSFRPNIVPDSSGDSFSGHLQLRRYFGDENYLQLSAGAGRSPTFVSSGQDVVVLKSKSASIDVYHSLEPLLFGSFGLSYSNDEIRSDTFRDDWTFNAGLEKRF
jgi:YaiO family outer membrane protein